MLNPVDDERNRDLELDDQAARPDPFEEQLDDGLLNPQFDTWRTEGEDDSDGNAPPPPEEDPGPILRGSTPSRFAATKDEDDS